jgi:hypothetical protein
MVSSMARNLVWWQAGDVTEFKISATREATHFSTPLATSSWNSSTFSHWVCYLPNNERLYFCFSFRILIQKYQTTVQMFLKTLRFVKPLMPYEKFGFISTIKSSLVVQPDRTALPPPPPKKKKVSYKAKPFLGWLSTLCMDTTLLYYMCYAL